jgi:hypothetical protein
MRGGKRKGAGRPTLPPGEKKKGFMVYWPPELIKELDKDDRSRSVVLEAAFKQARRD